MSGSKTRLSLTVPKITPEYNEDVVCRFSEETFTAKTEMTDCQRPWHTIEECKVESEASSLSGLPVSQARFSLTNKELSVHDFGGEDESLGNILYSQFANAPRLME